MRMLRENNVDAYYEMLKDAKEERLLSLMQQTDECLNRIGAALDTQRKKVA